MYTHNITKISISDIYDLHNHSPKYDIFKYSLKSDSCIFETGYGIIDYEPDTKRRKQAREEYVQEMIQNKYEKDEPLMCGIMYAIIKYLPELIEKYPAILEEDTVRLHNENRYGFGLASFYCEIQATRYKANNLVDKVDKSLGSNKIEAITVNIRKIIETYAISTSSCYIYNYLFNADTNEYECKVQLKPGFRNALNNGKSYKEWTYGTAFPTPGFCGLYQGLAISSINGLFSKAKIIEADLSHWVLPYLKSAFNLFYCCYNLKYAYIWSSGTELIDFSYAFKLCSDLEYVIFPEFDWSTVKSIKGMFENCQNLKEVDFGGKDMPNATAASRVFYGCEKLRKIENLNLSNTRCRMDNMFVGRQDLAI